MSDTVIKVENLSRQYRLSVFGRGSLRRDLQSWWARRLDREDPNLRVDQVNPGSLLPARPVESEGYPSGALCPLRYCSQHQQLQSTYTVQCYIVYRFGSTGCFTFTDEFLLMLYHQIQIAMRFALCLPR